MHMVIDLNSIYITNGRMSELVKVPVLKIGVQLKLDWRFESFFFRISPKYTGSKFI